MTNLVSFKHQLIGRFSGAHKRTDINIFRIIFYFRMFNDLLSHVNGRIKTRQWHVHHRAGKAAKTDPQRQNHEIDHQSVHTASTLAGFDNWLIDGAKRT